MGDIADIPNMVRRDDRIPIGASVGRLHGNNIIQTLVYTVLFSLCHDGIWILFILPIRRIIYVRISRFQLRNPGSGDRRREGVVKLTAYDALCRRYADININISSVETID